ncbi:MAG: arginine--tRNA ligase [Ignavibacteriales bacterium]|nr:arginine--tRNA ligase [Ignavibacteriales bacterium]
MKEYLVEIFNRLSEKIDYLRNIEILFSVPTQLGHGDYSTNIAMILSKQLKRSPTSIANEIVQKLQYDSKIIDKVEIAPPGFLNFYFKSDFINNIIKTILNENSNYGKSEKYKNKKALVEFVSANPTGPLTVGHGRNAVVGDTVANMLETVGYNVDREYYFNNAGRQMRILADSVKLRYLEICGEKIDFPEDYYQGEYIKDIAQKIYDEKGKGLSTDKNLEYFQNIAETEIFTDIKNTLKNIGIEMDSFYNEYCLYENKAIENLLNTFKEKELSYEKDGALWFKLSQLGQEADKVIIKSTGEPTYRLPDIAYHVTKYQRGYELLVDLFGSDHNATYPDVVAGVKALGYDTTKLKVLIHQFVTIMEKGSVVKMSTRKANFITLDELINEVGADVVRYFFIMRSIHSHLNFDLELAKKHSDENPVFYIQYAHARICSILQMTKEQELNSSIEHLDLLTTESEQVLIKKLYKFSYEVLYSTENYEPHRIALYLEELAESFHKFYTECRVIGVEKDLSEARISLCIATRIVFRNGFKILGINAPERM